MNADELGRLTPKGKEVLEAYKEIYPKLLYNEGYLTHKGQMQHRQIADQIYRNYPEIFKGKTRAEVLSTDSHRVMLSMMCCLDEICMASNIQIVFFRSKKNPDDILIQVLLNGFQGTLPLPGRISNGKLFRALMNLYYSRKPERKFYLD